MKFWIGTSGYSYDDWIGSFYPSRIRKAAMLAYYANKFSICELNFTFYRMPTRDQMRRFSERASHLNWIVKLHGDISHRRREDQIGPFLDAMQPIHEQGKLRSLLLQFPQSFHRTPENRILLQTLTSRMAPYPLHIEFRHRSWCIPEILERCRTSGVNLVSVDVPEIPALFPKKYFANQDNIFIRFHSRSASNWYAGEKARYDYDYSVAELEEWVAQIELSNADEANTVDNVYLIFNNCHRGQAAANAATVESMIADRFGSESVVEAKGESVIQKDLFGSEP